MQGPLRIVDFAVQIVDLCKALLEYHGHNALIVTPSPAHCSVNDVATMQLLAQDIGFEQKYLLEPPKRWGKDAMAQKGSSAYKLLYDPQAKLLHKSDCELLPDDRYLPAFLTFKLPIRRKYKPCSCCIHDRPVECG